MTDPGDRETCSATCARWARTRSESSMRMLTCWRFRPSQLRRPAAPSKQADGNLALETAAADFQGVQDLAISPMFLMAATPRGRARRQPLLTWDKRQWEHADYLRACGQASELAEGGGS